MKYAVVKEVILTVLTKHTGFPIIKAKKKIKEGDNHD